MNIINHTVLDEIDPVGIDDDATEALASPPVMMKPEML
jgi:hypothetical protein